MKLNLSFCKKKQRFQATLITTTADAIAKQNKAWGDGGLKTLIINDKSAGQIQTIQVGRRHSLKKRKNEKVLEKLRITSFELVMEIN